MPPVNPGPVVRTEHGPLAAPAITAHVPSGQVVVSGADAVLGRQAGERDTAKEKNSNSMAYFFQKFIEKHL